MDTIYCERANGRLEVWTYVEGGRYYLRPQPSAEHVRAYARLNNYRVVWVS